MPSKQQRERCLKKSLEDAATNCKTINTFFRSRSKADQLGDTGEPENKRQRVFNEGPDNEREGEKKGDFEVLRHRDGRGGERNERGGKEAGGDDDGPRNGDERGGEKTAGDNEGLLSRIL